MGQNELVETGFTPEIQIQNLHHYFHIKRAVDITLCLLLLPFFIILASVISLLIMIDSPGSPFFVQERIGKDRRRFRLYKFRTMRSDYDDQEGRVFMKAYVAGLVKENQKDDSQDAYFKPIKSRDITRIGRILRKTSLDELPQLINILKGEMSWVGPRPNVPWEVDSYRDWHYKRLAVLPGITGLAQIHGRSNILFDEIVTYDIQYVQQIGIKMDFTIIWQTMMIVLKGDGAG